MGGWWVHSLYEQGRTVELVSWIFWVLLSITLHELAHGWAALWQGDDTPKRLNRMSLNPIVHMGMTAMIVFALAGIAWGVMPVTPSRFRWGRRGRIFVSAAGPAMNLVLAIITIAMLALLIRFGPASGNLAHNLAVFLFTGAWLNLLLAIFNLLPVPPLDGSSILSGLSIRAYTWFQNPQAAMFGLVVVFVIFFMSPIGDLLIDGCQRAVVVSTGLLSGPPPQTPVPPLLQGG